MRLPKLFITLGKDASVVATSLRWVAVESEQKLEGVYCIGSNESFSSLKILLDTNKDWFLAYTSKILFLEIDYIEGDIKTKIGLLNYFYNNNTNNFDTVYANLTAGFTEISLLTFYALTLTPVEKVSLFNTRLNRDHMLLNMDEKFKETKFEYIEKDVELANKERETLEMPPNYKVESLSLN